MAKRFTDTDKWKKEWYRELGSKYRDIWNYLCDNCDHAGIWEIDLKTLAHFTGQRVTLDEIAETFGPRVVLLRDNKLFVRGFFDFQYGKSKKEFKARVSALEVLREYGLVDENGGIFEVSPNCPEHLPNCLEHLGDSIGESPNCPGIGNSKSIGIGKSKEGGVGETKPKPPKFDFEALYQAYPRREGKLEGMNRLKSRIKTQDQFDLFAKAVHGYCAKVKHEGTEMRFCKHWSSFVGAEDKEPWRDYVDWQPPARPSGMDGWLVEA